jgi:hypothetical protein
VAEDAPWFASHATVFFGLWTLAFLAEMETEAHFTTGVSTQISPIASTLLRTSMEMGNGSRSLLRLKVKDQDGTLSSGAVESAEADNATRAATRTEC